MNKNSTGFRLIVVKYLLLVAVTFVVMQITTNISALSAGNRLETRCGWFANPTPANAWLLDRHGQWTIGLQGGYQAEGNWPNYHLAAMGENKSQLWLRVRVHES